MRALVKEIERMKEKGLFRILLMFIQLPFFFFYRLSFKKCKRIYIMGSFQIRGKKYIQIDSFSAGSRIRIDAISKYNDQIFNPSIAIGKKFIANNDIHIACTGEIKIGDNVLLGSNIYITDHDHGIYSNCSKSMITNPMEMPTQRKLTSDGYIHIGNNVFIGEYVTILKKVSIGEGCIIGAHSLVLKDIPSYSIAAGNPARVIKKFNFQSNIWESCK